MGPGPRPGWGQAYIEFTNLGLGGLGQPGLAWACLGKQNFIFFQKVSHDKDLLRTAILVVKNLELIFE